MKTNFFVLTLTLCFSLPALAETSASVYHIAGTNRVIGAKTDSNATSLQSVPGLVLNGAVADGEWMIVSGQPSTIAGSLDGKPVCLQKGPPPVPEKTKTDVGEIKKRIAFIKERIALIDADKTDTSASSAPALPTWEIRTGEKIEDALKRWTSNTTWRVIWDGPDIASRVDVSLQAPFEDAVQEVVMALNRSGSSVRAYFYRKNNVLRITGGHR